MTTFDKIKRLCIYSEKLIDDSNIEVSYLSQELSSNKLSNLRKEREKKLCEILDEEFVDYVEEIVVQPGFMDTISINIKKINIKGKKHLSLTNEIILDELINLINKLSLGKFSSMNNTDVVLGADMEANTRRIVTRIHMLNNYITMSSRNPATFLLINTFDKNLFDNIYNISNLNLSIVESHLIKKGRVLIGSNRSQQDGIYVNKSENTLFIKETPNFKNSIAWFDIIY